MKKQSLKATINSMSGQPSPPLKMKVTKINKVEPTTASPHLSIRPEEIAWHLQWLARGGNDHELLTFDYFIQSVAATILSVTEFTADEEARFLGELRLKWGRTSMGYRIITKA